MPSLGDGVRVLFTTRHGGVSSGRFATLNLSRSVGDDPAAVEANRQVVLGSLGGGPGSGPSELAWMRQVHGAGVAYAAPAERPADSPEADAIFTASAQVALAVNVADCAPVLLADPD